MLIPILLLAAAEAAAVPPAAASLADTERAFAKMCVEKGMRASFSEFFAHDAIDFEPQPVHAAASLPGLSDGTAPFTLDWEPTFADVSASGDLGYDTGPYVITDRKAGKKSPRHGNFLSVWKRQPDGRWKVALDVGTRAPAPPGALRPAALATARPLWSGKTNDPRAERTNLLAQDWDSEHATSTIWLAEARLQRDDAAPLVGREAIESMLAGRGSFRAAPEGGDVSAAGDLGYTYGRYLTGSDDGYYARVWKRDGDGTWKIAAQIERPRPPEKVKK
jgi:ketosteroid isomerase-like protein